MFCLPKLEDFFSKLKNLENPFAGEIKKKRKKPGLTSNAMVAVMQEYNILPVAF